MIDFAANIVIIVAGVIYIADNWQQLKNLFNTNPPGT